MCTVSFLPTTDGFRLAMNRDEKRTRIVAEPPRIVWAGKLRAILPREPRGGSWIAVNEAGACFALINWHTIEREPCGLAESRGQVVAALAGRAGGDEIIRVLRALPLRSLRPFRLITIDGAERKITEWRWNLRQLRRRECAWELAHWFSSGFDEPHVEAVRANVCASHGDNPDIAALRRLHRSHAPKRGPFSICMHRTDAATVSYTEAIVAPRHVAMCYRAGPPCAHGPLIRKKLTRL